jgi:hypothetical protein
MSKESTKAAFKKAFSAHMLLNLSPEEEASLRTYGKSEERIRMEQQLRSVVGGYQKTLPFALLGFGLIVLAFVIINRVITG